jgi:hemoglobin
MSETIYEHLGGIDALRRLTRIFYGKVRVDPELEALFGAMPDDHPERVALWLAEVFGGPQQYTGERGGYATMVLAHINLGITESQRARWAELLYASLDEAELPADERFRRTFHDYIEWGTRIAMRNSQVGFRPPREAHVPTWPWSPDPD